MPKRAGRNEPRAAAPPRAAPTRARLQIAADLLQAGGPPARASAAVSGFCGWVAGASPRPPSLPLTAAAAASVWTPMLTQRLTRAPTLARLPSGSLPRRRGALPVPLGRAARPAAPTTAAAATAADRAAAAGPAALAAPRGGGRGRRLEPVGVEACHEQPHPPRLRRLGGAEGCMYVRMDICGCLRVARGRFLVGVAVGRRPASSRRRHQQPRPPRLWEVRSAAVRAAPAVV